MNFYGLSASCGVLQWRDFFLEIDFLICEATFVCAMQNDEIHAHWHRK